MPHLDMSPSMKKRHMSRRKRIASIIAEGRKDLAKSKRKKKRAKA